MMQCCTRLSSSIILLWLVLLRENSALTSVKTNKKVPNDILGIETSCTGENMTVTVDMEQRFHGAIHAKGFPIECRAVGQGETYVQLTVAASSCGLRITPHKDGGLVYHLVVEVQATRHLQQATDISLLASCYLPKDQIVLHSPALNSLQHKRSGRNMQHDSKARINDSNKDNHDGTAKAWLEIQGSGDSEVKSVNVGERTTLKLKAWLPDGVDSRVVDCVAHDGAGESSQQLVDGEGCPVDRQLVPAFQHTTAVTDELTLHQHATSFPAFKFPDRSALHIRCALMICSHACSLLNCPATQEEDLASRSDRKLNDDVDLLDQVQLFNSIEVVAPGIETDALTKINHLRQKSRGEEWWWWCVVAPAPATAVWLACAGLILLMALLASLCVLVRGRMRTRQNACVSDESRNRLLFASPFVW